MFGFKTVNDTLGHQTGDRLLVETGQVVRSLARRNDTVARLGGDAFAFRGLERSADEVFSTTDARRYTAMRTRR